MKKKILITGCAGFIGFHLCHKLIKKNFKIFGIDNLNKYYDVNLKLDRLNILNRYKNFSFSKLDITQKKKLNLFFKKKNFDIIVHLAAQAGVRYSILNPSTYLDNNVIGFFNIIEAAQKNNVSHFVYASTSSVYGQQSKMPYNENFLTDRPLSFYAATKKCNEVLAHSFSAIHKLPTTGLRFFTVYGPYGRPDMSLFKFAKSIHDNKHIELFNKGNHSRDFSYIDDVTEYIFRIMIKKPEQKIPFQIYNVARSKREKLLIFLKYIEKYLGKKSKKKLMPLQKGDVKDTYGSIKKIIKLTKYKPKINIVNGVKNFINWFNNYYK